MIPQDERYSAIALIVFCRETLTASCEEGGILPELSFTVSRKKKRRIVLSTLP